jgi:hypothetical protein
MVGVGRGSWGGSGIGEEKRRGIKNNRKEEGK